MFYYYIRIFNWISSIFGLHRPYICVSGKIHKNTRWLNLWSLIVCLSFIAIYFYPNNFWFEIKVQTHLNEISSANNLLVNIIIILINACNGEAICFQIYSILNNTLQELYIQNQSQKLFAIKLYLWITLPLMVLIILIIMEIIYANPPFSLVVKMPILLTILHLVIHLSLILAILKVINSRFLEKSKIYNNFLLPKFSKPKGIYHYLLNPALEFYYVNSQRGQVNLKLLCKLYDNIGISMRLLQNNHGIQILLSVWLMFSNAVTGITLITNERANMAWVVIVRSALPFVWYFMGCYVDNQLRQEVERTYQLIIKNLIDFRCDQPTREVLQAFKQVVEANRLEFIACNLYRLNYATILGTIVNVITYSIILIQVL